MLGFGAPNVKVISNTGIVGAATPWTAVPSHAATPDTDGAVTELISAANNTQESWGIEVLVTATGASTVVAQAKMSILIGGATDDVLLPDLICGYSTLSGLAARYFFPVHVPGGVRIAAVLNTVRTGINSRCMVNLYGGGYPPFRVGSRVDVLGTEISGSRGKAVTPTASGGAASVTEMVASSARDYYAFLPGFQPATDGTLTPTGYFCVGVGIGAATEERIGTWWYGKNTAEDFGPVGSMLPAFRSVPAATRISLLVSNSGANDAAHDGHIYAVA
jgi:hypothetical protein